ncbi:MAG: hypothetical protein ACRD4Q_03825, partial [Candidatus Acidiferrales bacterium]
MPSPFIIDNWTTDQNGNVIGQTIGEQLFDTGGLNCQDLFWSGQLWLGDPNDVYLQQRATQIAQDGGNEK